MREFWWIMSWTEVWKPPGVQSEEFHISICCIKQTSSFASFCPRPAMKADQRRSSRSRDACDHERTSWLMFAQSGAGGGTTNVYLNHPWLIFTTCLPARWVLLSHPVERCFLAVKKWKLVVPICISYPKQNIALHAWKVEHARPLWRNESQQILRSSVALQHGRVFYHLCFSIFLFICLDSIKAGSCGEIISQKKKPTKYKNHIFRKTSGVRP